LELYPNALPTIGPAIDNGFYYDFEFPTPITESDLKDIEKRMRKLLPSWKAMTGKEVSKDEATLNFSSPNGVNQYKAELINEIVTKNEPLTLYTAGHFTDLCRGGHSENPAKEIAADSFKLHRLAGAYWRGDEKNKQLTRIYGLAFNTKDELDAYVNMMKDRQGDGHI
jgi:threonyl-tRNA synthetase